MVKRDSIKLLSCRLIHLDEPEHSVNVYLGIARKIRMFKPDVIAFELPATERDELAFFNKFKPNEKPKEQIVGAIKNLEHYHKIYPWLRGQAKIMEEIANLWEQGKQIFLFKIDAPLEVTSHVTKGRLTIVKMLIRDIYMLRNLVNICEKYQNSCVLVVCHNYHWENLKYLIKHKNLREIVKHYFGRDVGIEGFIIDDYILKRHFEICKEIL